MHLEGLFSLAPLGEGWGEGVRRIRAPYEIPATLTISPKQTTEQRPASADLNYGYCFSYASAKTRGASLLFKGSDFAQTDLGSTGR